jgi:hypothetical protein
MTPPAERPSQTAQVDLALRALDELVRAAHQWSLYGVEHPITRQACDAAAAALVAMMSGRAHFTLTVTDSALLAEGEELPDHAPLRQLHENLRRRQIAGLTIRPGLAWEEIAALIGVLATDPVELGNTGGARHALMEAGCSHVELADVDYSRFIPESQAQWLSSFSGGAGGIQSSVQDLVSVCLEIPGDRLQIPDKNAAAERGIPMPFPIPVTAPGGEAGEVESPAFQKQLAALHDVAPDDYLAVGLAWLIQASGEAVLEAPPKDRRAWREIVAERIAMLDLGLQARIFRAPRQGGSDTPDMLAALVADRSPQAIADLILARPAAVVGEPSALLERILRRTLTDERKLIAVEPLLRQRLMERGMSEESFRNVVGLLLDQIATDMAMRVGGASEFFGDFEELPLPAGGSVDQWPDLLKTISSEAVAQARVRVLLNMLPHDYDAAAYLDLVGHMETCVAERAAADDPYALELIRALAAEVETGDSVRAPIASAGLQRLGTQEVVHLMREALARTPPEQRPELFVMMQKMGNLCADILLEEAEGESDPQLRALAVRCLADAGERGAAEVRHLLAQGPFDQAIFAAAALIEGRDQRLLNLLAAGFDHRQAAVRIRVAQSLGRVPGLVSEQLLIRALYDEDPAVQAQAAASLGEMRATGAVHALSLAARKGSLHGRALEVRKAAIQALGKIGAPEAVPALTEVLRKRSVWFKERAEELSGMAAAALALIPGPEAQRALAQYAPQSRKRAGASHPTRPEQAAQGSVLGEH